MKRKRNLRVGDGLVAVGSTRTLAPARRVHGRPSGNAVHLTHRTMDGRLIARKTGFPDADFGPTTRQQKKSAPVSEWRVTRPELANAGRLLADDSRPQMLVTGTSAITLHAPMEDGSQGASTFCVARFAIRAVCCQLYVNRPRYVLVVLGGVT
jgi:hypothetical protein